MTIPQEAGKAARSAIDVMRASPALIAVILLQIVTLGFLYFIHNASQQRQHTREMAMIERCWDDPPKR